MREQAAFLAAKACTGCRHGEKIYCGCKSGIISRVRPQKNSVCTGVVLQKEMRFLDDGVPLGTASQTILNSCGDPQC